MESFGEYNDKGMLRRYRLLDKIATAEDAYFLGYMYGDGAFVVNRGFSFLAVNSTCKEVIDAFRDRYSPDSIVRNIGLKSSEKVKAVREVYETRFPPKFSKQFDKFGLFCKKDDRRLIGVKDIFFINVLHGLVDSDGYWNVVHRKDCRKPRLRIFITHRSEHFLRDVQNKLEALYNVASTVAPHTSGGCFRLGIQNTDSAIRLSEAMMRTEYACNPYKKAIVNKYLLQFRAPEIG